MLGFDQIPITPAAPKMDHATVETKQAELMQATQEKVARFSKELEVSRAAEAERLAQQAGYEQSWSGQLGLPSGSFAANRVNDAASLVSGTSRLVGQIASLPVSALGMAQTLAASPEDYNSYNRWKVGQATPEDMARLNSKADGLTSGSILDRFNNAEELRGVSRDINNATDLTKVVDPTNRTALDKDLAKDFNKNWADFKDGGTASQVISGLAGLLYNTGAAVLSNPSAVREYVVENAPQLLIGTAGKAGQVAMAASNLGYAADYYQQGIENFAKENQGQLPSDQQRQTMAMEAASLAAAEHLGDHIGLALMKPAAKEAIDATAVSLKQNLKNSLKAAAEGFASETATEGYQTWAEGDITGKPASAFDVYQGGLIGGLSGAALSGGAHHVATMLDATPEQAQAQQNRQTRDEEFAQAAANNDPTIYTDKESKRYDPVNAVGVLFANNLQETATPESMQNNRERAVQIFDDLDKELEALLEQRKTADKDVAKDLDKQILTINTQLDGVLTGVNKITDHMNALPSKEEVQATVEQANTPGTEEAAQAAEQIINLAMQNTSSISKEDAQSLAENQDNSLTPLQRDYLAAFSAARQSEEQLSGMNKVSQEILTGSKKPGGNVGITQYQDRISNAMLAGREDIATRQLGMLESFATNHLSKAKAAMDALTQYGLGGTIVKTATGGWEVATRPYTTKELQANGGMVINSARLAQNMQIEAQALTNAHAEMQKAIALRFGSDQVQSESSAAQNIPAPSQNNLYEKDVEDEARPESKLSEPLPASPTSKPSSAVVADAPSATASSLASAGENLTNPSTSQAVQPEVTAQPAVVAAPAETQAPAVQVTTTAEEVKSEPVKGLPLYADKTPAGTVKPYQKRNLVADHTVQMPGNEKGSLRPLVEVPGFLSKLKDNAQEVARTYLKADALTDQQGVALKTFVKKAEQWVPSVVKNFIKGNDEKYYHKDLSQYFMDKDGKVDENVPTAIAYAAFSWAAENATRSAINSDDEINALLGNDEGTLVTDAARYELSKVGTREPVVANALGQRIVQAMGIRSLASTPKNILPQLESQLGSHALKLLLDEGILKRTRISGEVFAGLTGKKSTDKNAKQKFITMARDDAGELSKAGQEIRTAVKGSQGVLDKLFGAEAGLKEPSFTKIPFTQKTTANTDQKVPSNLAKIMAHENAQPHYVRLDMWHLMDQLHPEIALAIAGVESINEKVTHVVNQLSIQAKNDGLRREYDNMMEYFRGLMAEDKMDQPLFFAHTVWKQHRVGIATNMINPQTSKLHRRMLARPSWSTEVRFSDPEAMENFKLRVAEGLGVKTDKQTNDKSLDEVVADIGRSEIKAAVKVLRKAITLDGLTQDEQVTLLSGVMAGGENMHTLDALMALAHYMEAIANGKDSFTTQLMGEVDGVTNGPMLTHLLLGAASSVGQLFQMLNRGGFYELNNDHQNYNLWRAENGSLDLYETTALHMVEAIQNLGIDQSTEQALYAFTGNLIKDDKVTVSKEGRNIIKTPLTAMVFGSSINKAIDSMADNFIKSVYGKMEDIAAGKADRAQLLKDLARLGIKMDANTTTEKLMATPLTPAQINTLKGVFKDTIGKAVTQTMEKDFATFIEQRRTFNLSAQMAFDLYHAAYTGLREQRIADLIKSGDIAVNATTGKPIHDLTGKQEAALRKEIQDILPLMHTAFSQEVNELDAGILAAKTGRELSTDSFYEGEMKFGTPFEDGSKSINTRAYARKESAPGVAPLIMLVHSTDSFISHTAVTKSEVLNIHDAHGAGLGNFKQTAQNLNQATWEAMLTYSPPTQIANTLTRVIQGVATMAEEGKLPEKSQVELQKVMAKYAKQLDTPAGSVLDIQVKAAKDLAYNADDMKLQALERMAAIDQYALQGGQYLVTDADRKAAKKARLFLKNELTDADQQALATLSALASGTKQFATNTVAEEYNELDSKPAIQIPNIPTNIALQLMEGMGPSMDGVKDALQRGEDLATAFTGLKEEAARFRLNQLEERYAAWQAAQGNPWGELGVPAITSDQRLVDAFKNDGGVLTAKQTMKVLREALTGNPDSRNNVFAGRLLTLIEKTVPAEMKVQMISPNTPTTEVLAKGADNSRGWFVAKGDNQSVYLLSPDFKQSGITVESLLHELTHAALARTVQAELDAKTKNPAYQSDALLLVQELDNLRTLAQEYIDTNKLNQFSPAVKDVHELISWGMSNLDFQRQVLNKVSLKSTTTGNKLVNGMKRFIEALTGLLFKGSTKSAQEQMESGLAVLIANTSGLFHAAAQTKAKVDLVLNQVNPQTGLNTYSTTDILEALGNMPTWGTPVSAGFQVQLKSLLTGIVNNLHGPFGSFKESLMKEQALSPVDVYTHALQTGVAPFASESLAAGFRITDQEAYVMEQVEVSMRTLLADKDGHTTAAYKELTKLYKEAYAKLKVENFHDGDWTLATPQEKAEAEALHAFVFAVPQDAQKASNYLARFAALGLAHERVANLLNFATRVSSTQQNVQLSFTEKLHDMFDRAMVWLNGRLTHTFAGQQADEKLMTLVQQLVTIEAKKKMVLNSPRNRTLDAVEGTLKALTDAGRKQMEAFGKSTFFQQSTKPFVKATGSVISMVAGDRVDMVMDAIINIRDRHFKERYGLMAGIVNEIRGANDTNLAFHKLSRVTKKIEGDRKDLITNVTKFTLESFSQGGQYLTPEQKAAVSQVFLRTDMAALLGQYSMEQLSKMVNDPVALKKEIHQHEQTLKGYQHYGHYFIRAAKQLGYFKVTGRLTGPNTVFNAGNIARLYGTAYAGRITEAMAQQALPTIDSLVSLYALAYVSPGQLAEARTVLDTENKRTNGNGVEMVLKLHKDLQKQSKDRLFVSGDTLYMKGYTPEITNPHVEIVVGDPTTAPDLEAQGYVKVSPLQLDKADPDRTVQTLYTLRDGGLQNYLSGTLSFTSRGTKGSKIHNGNTSLLSKQGLANTNAMHTVAQNNQAAIRDMFNPNPGFDPRQVQENYMAPVLNPAGDVVNYRYMMQDKVRDTLLERDNRFEQLLGVMAGNIFDKEVSATQNHKVIEALKEQYEEDHKVSNYLDRSKSYREVGPHSTDPEMREIWRMLPEATKESVRQIWGHERMMVRLDLMDINFGYRKLSISDIFEQDRELESGIERVIHEIGTFLFGQKARLRTRQFEEVWQAFVREAKDTMVVKSGVTLLGNITSNITELYWFGVPLTEIARHHKVAIQGAMAYRRDSEELARINLQLSIDYLPSGDKKDLEHQKRILEDALVKNPVHNLIEAGLMPTIVEDVALDDDLYSYKNRFTRKVEGFVDQLNPHVVNTAKFLAITHDTPLYKSLSYATQLSDFVARYTLYQYVTQRQVKPMGSEEAIQLVSDAFINYDVPSHRLLQYGNDMGFVYFTKYYLRIQKVIMHLYRDNPGRALMLLAANHYFEAVPMLVDSQVTHRLGNPLSIGALKYVTSLDELATVNALLTPFK